MARNNFFINVSDKDMANVIEIAGRPGGSGHWCSLFQHICPGQWKAYNKKENGFHTLYEEDIYEGIKKYIEEPRGDGFLTFDGSDLKIDMSRVTEKIADTIIQYALFGEIRYYHG